MNAQPAPGESLGVIVALPGEARSLVPRRIRAGEQAIFDGGLLAVCGIGPRRAAAAAEALVAAGCRRLLSWGVAGGLDAALEPGDLIVADSIVDTAGGEFVVDAALAAAVQRALAPLDVRRATLLSGAEPVLSVAARQRAAQSGAACVDMESAAVAAVAARAGIAFAAVKAICDPAGCDVPPALLALVDGEGRLRASGIATVFAAGPGSWRAVARLRRNYAAARGSLSKAAPLVVAALTGDAR